MARIVEATAGKTRDRPVSQRLRRVLTYAARVAGVDIVRVTSGGQAKKGAKGKRTGSIRHDLGNAADLQLVSNGRTLDFTKAADRAVFESFVSASRSAGATGIGAGLGYMGPSTIHVGFGGAATWGAGGAAANAPDWLRSAYDAGALNPVDVGAGEASAAARADAIARIAALGFSGPNAIRNFQAAQGFKGKDLDGILGPKTMSAATAPNVTTASGAKQFANLMGGAPLVSGVAPVPGAPVPPNAIPGVPDPTAPIPRSNPGVEPEGSIGMGIGATGGVQAAGSANLDMTPAPKPRARPNQLAKTIERVLTKRGTLRKGAKGEEVAEVQRVLNAMGVTDNRGRPLTIDGNLGTLTRQAIRNYQEQHPELVGDGILGPRTLTQMVRDIETVTAPTATGIGSDFVASGGIGAVASGFGEQIARGFQPPTAGPAPLATSLPTPGGRTFTPSTLSPGPRGDSPYVSMVAGLSAQPSQSRAFDIRDADAFEAMNAFTPHSTGKLGASRGLSFETLDRDAEPIYSAATAFARQRVEARESGPSRLDFASLNSRSTKDFEFQFGGSGDSFLRDSSGRRVFSRDEAGGTGGAGNPSRAVNKNAGFTDRGSGGNGFKGRANQQAPRSASQSSGSQGAGGRTGQSGTGQSSRTSSQASSSRAGTVSRPSNDPSRNNRNSFGGPR